MIRSVMQGIAGLCPLLCLLAAPRIARADVDDDVEPAVANAGEANLESTAVRQGIQFSGMLGGALALGFHMKDATGTGGAISLRLGEPMTPKWVLTVEIEGGGQLHRAPGMNGKTNLDNDTNLLLGTQYYPNDSFFVRVGFGIGTYMQTAAARDNSDHKYVGPAVGFGAGLELVKLKHLVFDFELFSVSMVNRDGVFSMTAFGFGTTIH